MEVSVYEEGCHRGPGASREPSKPFPKEARLLASAFPCYPAPGYSKRSPLGFLLSTSSPGPASSLEGSCFGAPWVPALPLLCPGSVNLDRHFTSLSSLGVGWGHGSAWWPGKACTCP